MFHIQTPATSERHVCVKIKNFYRSDLIVSVPDERRWPSGIVFASRAQCCSSLGLARSSRF